MSYTDQEFLEEVKTRQIANSGRVLYLRDISDISWVRNTYISFEASPVSVMYGNVDAQSVSPEDIIKMAADAHAAYLYVDEVVNGKELFDGLSDSGTFEYGCLYQVKAETENTILIKVD